MPPRAAAGVIAGIVLVVGIIVGFVPHSVDLDYRGPDGETSVSCGSAFASDDRDADLAGYGSDIRAAFDGKGVDAGTDFVAACSDALSTPRVFAWVLIGLGALGGLFLFLTTRASASRPQPGGETSAPGAGE